MANTFYMAFNVLKKWITDNGLTIVNFSMQDCSLDRVVMWVQENAAGYTHFVCIQTSPTQFLIWGYGNDYTQLLSTSYDFADANTPENTVSAEDVQNAAYSKDYNSE